MSATLQHVASNMVDYPPPHISTNKPNGMDLANGTAGNYCSALCEPLASLSGGTIKRVSSPFPHGVPSSRGLCP